MTYWFRLIFWIILDSKHLDSTGFCRNCWPTLHPGPGKLTRHFLLHLAICLLMTLCNSTWYPDFFWSIFLILAGADLQYMPLKGRKCWRNQRFVGWPGGLDQKKEGRNRTSCLAWLKRMFWRFDSSQVRFITFCSPLSFLSCKPFSNRHDWCILWACSLLGLSLIGLSFPRVLFSLFSPLDFKGNQRTPKVKWYDSRRTDFCALVVSFGFLPQLKGGHVEYCIHKHLLKNTHL